MLLLLALHMVLLLQMLVVLLIWDMLPGALERLELLVVLEFLVDLEVEMVLLVLILEGLLRQLQHLPTDLLSASSPPWAG